MYSCTRCSPVMAKLLCLLCHVPKGPRAITSHYQFLSITWVSRMIINQYFKTLSVIVLLNPKDKESLVSLFIIQIFTNRSHQSCPVNFKEWEKFSFVLVVWFYEIVVELSSECNFCGLLQPSKNSTNTFRRPLKNKTGSLLDHVSNIYGH